ncbi:hypothetical protein DSS3P8_130 [Roseobacter phage DSS3P8]|nr:hypothetical protein DSS3P8_130 [Roseobacter phage DSS3P8]
MFEIIGIFAVWVIGLVASFYVPLIAVMQLNRTEGLAGLAYGVFAAKACTAIYLAATIIYFIAT